MTREELFIRVIWETVMETTAWTGTPDRLKEALVFNVQKNVLWAYGFEGDEFLKRVNEATKNEVLSNKKTQA